MPLQVQRVASQAKLHLRHIHGGLALSLISSYSSKTCHTAGLALLCFMVLPYMDSVKALLLTASIAIGGSSSSSSSCYWSSHPLFSAWVFAHLCATQGKPRYDAKNIQNQVN